VFELAIFVAEDLVVLNAEYVARGCKLGAADLAQLGIRFSVAAIAAGGAGGEADISTPRSAARAMAPPKAKHSSSGWAKIQRRRRLMRRCPRDAWCEIREVNRRRVAMC